MKPRTNLLGVAILLLPIITAIIIYSCISNEVRNEVEQVVAPTKAVDTTIVEIPEEDTTQHEITFSPSVDVWIISGEDTIKL